MLAIKAKSLISKFDHGDALLDTDVDDLIKMYQAAYNALETLNVSEYRLVYLDVFHRLDKLKGYKKARKEG